MPVEYWSDTALRPGEDYDHKIREKLGKADLVVPLITAQYLASDWCMEELDIAMTSRKDGRCVVAPIIVEPSRYERTVVNELNVLPGNARPVTEWGKSARAWTDVVTKLDEEIDRILDLGVPPVESDVEKVLRPFNSISPEIRKSLDGAASVWLLTRSGSGWWHDFDRIEALAEEPSDSRSRFLVLNPASEAFRSHQHDWETWAFDPKDDFKAYASKVETFLKAELLPRDGETIEARALDVRLPLALLFVNPHEVGERSCVYVEYPRIVSPENRSSDYQGRPVVRISPLREELHYQHLRSAFEGLWKRGAQLQSIEL